MIVQGGSAAGCDGGTEVLGGFPLRLFGLVQHRGGAEEFMHHALVMGGGGGHPRSFQVGRKLLSLITQDVTLARDHQGGGH